MPARHTLGQKLRALRKEKGLTQQQLAGQEFTKSFISQIEKDTAKPSLKSLQVLADRLGRPVSYFLEDAPKVAAPKIPDRVYHLLTLAQKLEEESLPEAAREYYEEALDAISDGSLHLRCRLHTYISRTLAATKNLPEASSLYQEAAAGFTALGDRHAAAKAGVEAGLIEFALGNNGKAEALLTTADGLLEPTESDTGFWRAFAQLYLGLTYRRLGQNKRALEHFSTALNTCARYQTFVEYGRICVEAGLVHLDEGESAQALAFFDRAVSFYRSIDRAQERARCEVLQAEAKYQLGEVDAAGPKLRSALDTLQYWVYPNETYRGHMLLAEIAEKAGNVTQALECAQTAQEFAPHQTQKLRAGIRIGRYLRLSGSTQASLKTLLSLQESAEEQTANEILAELYSELAETHTELGQVDAGQSCLKKSLALYRRMS